MSVLAEIVASTRDHVASRRRAVSLETLEVAGAERARAGDRRPFAENLRVAAAGAGRIAVIAEHKRSSPSAGVIRADAELADVVRAYERGGAAALSVLTEETRFGGSLDDLRDARAASSLPILRKDFIVEDYQVHEALAAGADAILLIVAALAPAQLAELHELAGTLGLEALVEVHDGAELAIAAELGAPIIGINNRNLATLEVDLATTFTLLPGIPNGTLVVAESGFRTRAELERLAGTGVDAVLIGEALMRAPDIEAACHELTGASRIYSSVGEQRHDEDQVLRDHPRS
jgi:indole-3-glycerol phosphate synthase